MRTPEWNDLQVVGTTTPVRKDELPARLEPVYLDTQGHYYLPIDDDTDGGVIPGRVDDEWIARQESNGDILMFARSFSAHPNHVLLQSDISDPAEYLPEADLGRRLVELCERALLDAAKACTANDRLAAEEYAWYAARAQPKAALPLLALRALLRNEVPADHLDFIERDLAALPEEQRRAALNTADRALEPLLRVVRSDMGLPEPENVTKYSSRPSYLDQLPDMTNFFAKARQDLSAARGRPQTFSLDRYSHA